MSYGLFLQGQLVRNVNQMLKNVETQKEKVVDARGAARFNGTAPEPRKGIRGGHIPGSLNVPFDSLLANGQYASCPQFFASRASSGNIVAALQLVSVRVLLCTCVLKSHTYLTCFIEELENCRLHNGW